LNSGRVLEKVGISNKKEVPQKEPLSFVVVDRKPDLNKNGIDYLCRWLEKLLIVTSNPRHPAFELKRAQLQDSSIRLVVRHFDVRQPS
jgi:2,5-diamino-6-(ribosylamino)-4(3H)-pyrimidinone 5'-phosphate reductase